MVRGFQMPKEGSEIAPGEKNLRLCLFFWLFLSGQTESHPSLHFLGQRKDVAGTQVYSLLLGKRGYTDSLGYEMVLLAVWR